jgi:uncharacterized protein
MNCPGGRRRASALLAAAALVALAASTAAAQAASPPPAPTRWATDEAGFLSEPARRDLDERLRAHEAATGRQFLVFIGRTTGGVPIEDFAVRAFAAWGVGRKGKDDGLVLFVFAEDRTARFEVGYGLEGALPDVAASRIIREVLAPRLQAGDRDGAVLAAAAAAIAEIARAEPEGALGPATPGPTGRPRGRPLSTAEKVVVGLVVLVFLFILITNPTLALYLIQVLASGAGGSRGGGSGGGGWSGGGGRSGGGGASGSW